jgi:NAD(P)H dehydrogenase (quinone)
MPKIAIVYESLSGNTKTLAEGVAEGVRAAGSEPDLLDVENVGQEELLAADGIIVGSYTSYGVVAGGIKTFFDRTASIHGKLAGKVGGAFASAGGFGGGAETTVLSILQILLVHGLIVPGDSTSPHFGAVAVEKPDVDSIEGARRLGRRVSELAAKLNGC